MVKAYESTEKFNSIKASMYLKYLVTSLHRPETQLSDGEFILIHTANCGATNHLICDHNTVVQGL